MPDVISGPLHDGHDHKQPGLQGERYSIIFGTASIIMSAAVIPGMQNSSSSSLQPVGSAGSSSTSSSRSSNSRGPAIGGSRCLSSRQSCLGMPYFRLNGLGVCGLGHKAMVATAVGGQHVAVPASSQAPAAATRLGSNSNHMRRFTSHVAAAQRRKLFGVSEGFSYGASCWATFAMFCPSTTRVWSVSSQLVPREDDISAPYGA